MQKKKLLLITSGSRDHASSRIRGIIHFERLKEDFSVTWLPRSPVYRRETLLEKAVFGFKKRWYILLQYLLILFYRFDIIFVQVVFMPEFLLRILKRRGTVICYDFDDAVYTYSQVKFDRMIDYADKIIVATPFLLDSFSRESKRYKVIFSPVDTDLIEVTGKNTGVFTIGWIGSFSTLIHLESLAPVFDELRERLKCKLLVIGGKLERVNAEVEYMAWSEQNELEVLKRIDVGIMPLAEHEWSAKKGGYKLYLYMAAGKPVVASPDGINGIIIKDGVNGFTATTANEWVIALERLNNDPVLRTELGRKAREDAEHLYSYNACTPQLRDFLQES